MLSRSDRKRPSAVLEDRLGSDRIVDLDSCSLSYLQIGKNCVEPRQVNTYNEGLTHFLQRLTSRTPISDNRYFQDKNWSSDLSIMEAFHDVVCGTG